MADNSRLRKATEPDGRTESTLSWIEQIRRRLIMEFVARMSVAEIAACIERARTDLDAPSPAALPELVERLARVRLRAQVGLPG